MTNPPLGFGRTLQPTHAPRSTSLQLKAGGADVVSGCPSKNRCTSIPSPSPAREGWYATSALNAPPHSIVKKTYSVARFKDILIMIRLVLATSLKGRALSL